MVLKKLFNYLMGKSSEAKHLTYKDAILANLVLTAHAKKRKEYKKFINISKLLCIHKIDRITAIKKIDERVKILKNKKNLLKKRNISQKELSQILPSISNFKVVKYGNKFVALEGNGRLIALKKVLKNVEIEVDVIDVELNSEIKKIRKMYELE